MIPFENYEAELQSYTPNDKLIFVVWKVKNYRNVWRCSRNFSRKDKNVLLIFLKHLCCHKLLSSSEFYLENQWMLALAFDVSNLFTAI